MKQKLYSVFLNIIISILFIVLFNMTFQNINLNIGLNPASVGIISLLGIPGIFPLVLAAIFF